MERFRRTLARSRNRSVAGHSLLYYYTLPQRVGVRIFRDPVGTQSALRASLAVHQVALFSGAFEKLGPPPYATSRSVVLSSVEPHGQSGHDCIWRGHAGVSEIADLRTSLQRLAPPHRSFSSTRVYSHPLQACRTSDRSAACAWTHKKPCEDLSLPPGRRYASSHLSINLLETAATTTRQRRQTRSCRSRALPKMGRRL